MKTAETRHTLCNKCGESFLLEDPKINYNGLLGLRIEWCYGNKHMSDESAHNYYDLCEECLFEIMGGSKIAAENFNSNRM